MARRLQLKFAGALYQGMARGVEVRQAIFADDQNRQWFLDLPGKELPNRKKGEFAASARGLLYSSWGFT